MLIPLIHFNPVQQKLFEQSDFFPSTIIILFEKSYIPLSKKAVDMAGWTTIV